MGGVWVKNQWPIWAKGFSVYQRCSTQLTAFFWCQCTVKGGREGRDLEASTLAKACGEWQIDGGGHETICVKN